MIRISSYQKLYLKNKILKILPWRQPIPSTKCFHVLYNEEIKVIWHFVPKVGYSTISSVFRNNNIALAEDSIGSATALDIYNISYFKFAFVRNPWDRIISCWKNKVVESNYWQFSDSERAKMKNLEHFLKFISLMDLNNVDGHIKLQSKLIDLNNVDFIGRFENFESDLTTVCSQIGLHNVDIPVENKSNREFSSYKDYYDSHTAAMVANLYEKDIQMLGYTF